MTMPHLMNCAHSGDGWCLACVKALGTRHRLLMQSVKILKDEALAGLNYYGDDGPGLVRLVRQIVLTAESALNRDDKIEAN